MCCCWYGVMGGRVKAPDRVCACKLWWDQKSRTGPRADTYTNARLGARYQTQMFVRGAQWKVVSPAWCSRLDLFFSAPRSVLVSEECFVQECARSIFLLVSLPLRWAHPAAAGLVFPFLLCSGRMGSSNQKRCLVLPNLDLPRCLMRRAQLMRVGKRGGRRSVRLFDATPGAGKDRENGSKRVRWGQWRIRYGVG